MYPSRKRIYEVTIQGKDSDESGVDEPDVCEHFFIEHSTWMQKQMSSPRITKLLAALMLVFGCVVDVPAQLFGSRMLGGGLKESTKTGPSSSFLLPAISDFPNSRIAGGAAEFVGRGRTDRKTFVGQSQGTVTGTVAPAAQEVRRRRRRNANTTALQSTQSSKNNLYAARLSIDFHYKTPSPADQLKRFNELLAGFQSVNGQDRITINLEGRTVTLRGWVVTENDRRLVEVLVGLQPGVSRVVNEIHVEGGSDADSN